MTDLNHKGMRSGIVRILAEFPEIQLENDASAKEFKVIIKRTTQKSDVTIQKEALKDNDTAQKSDVTTQKSESATQKDSLKDSNTIPKTDITTQKDGLKDSNTILKALEPIQAEVLRYIMAHPQTTREEIADSIDGISFGGVKFIICRRKAC